MAEPIDWEEELSRRARPLLPWAAAAVGIAIVSIFVAAPAISFSIFGSQGQARFFSLAAVPTTLGLEGVALAIALIARRRTRGEGSLLLVLTILALLATGFVLVCVASVSVGG